MKNSDTDNMNKIKHMEYLRKASLNNWGLKSHSFIYKVISGFRAISNNITYIKDGKVITDQLDKAEYKRSEIIYIEKGSFIEFRYEYDAHCRDIENRYWCIDASILAIKCEPFARILSVVRAQNKMNLKEILDTKSYELVL